MLKEEITMNATRKSELTVWVVLAGLGLIFGSAFLSVKVLVGAMSPMQVVAGRLGLAALSVLVVLALRRDLPSMTRALLAGGAVLALLDCFVPYALIAWASQDLDSGMAAVLMSTLPLFTALFAARTLPDEQLSAAKIAGLLAGFAGVAVLVGPEALDPRGGVGLAHAAVLCGAVSYGAAAVYARVLCRTEGVVDVTAVKLVLGAALAAGLSLAVDGAPAVSLGTGEVVALVALGVVSTGLGRLVYLWAITEAGSVRASLVTYIIPIVALALGWLVLGEEIATGTVAGMAMIVAGVAGVMYGDRVPLPRVALRGRRVAGAEAA
jgi:drug/metabolite transporter (DMT)-like permease